jgi:hypothetical protein
VRFELKRRRPAGKSNDFNGFFLLPNISTTSGGARIQSQVCRQFFFSQTKDEVLINNTSSRAL